MIVFSPEENGTKKPGLVGPKYILGYLCFHFMPVDLVEFIEQGSFIGCGRHKLFVGFPRKRVGHGYFIGSKRWA